MAPELLEISGKKNFYAFALLWHIFAASEKSKVNNVSLTIENKGDIICLLGPSGIGKTTILRTATTGLEWDFKD